MRNRNSRLQANLVFALMSMCYYCLTRLLLLSVVCLCLLSLCTVTAVTSEPEFLEEKPPPSDILPNSPRFILKLPDNNLLCFSIEGCELFTYNLITSKYLVLNAFLNLTSLHLLDQPYNKTRGFSDIGFIIKSVDKRVRGGKRFFKHLIYGERKRAVMDGFGEVDITKGAVTFTLRNGHSNIESQVSDHETFRVVLDKPKCNIVVVSSNGHTFNAYIEDGVGLLGVNMHGLIGEWVEHTRIPNTMHL